MRLVEALRFVVRQAVEHAAVPHVVAVDQRVRVPEVRQVAIIHEQRACRVRFPVEHMVQVVRVVPALHHRVIDGRCWGIQPALVILVDVVQLDVVDLCQPPLDDSLRHRNAVLRIRAAQGFEQRQEGLTVLVGFIGLDAILRLPFRRGRRGRGRVRPGRCRGRRGNRWRRDGRCGRTDGDCRSCGHRFRRGRRTVARCIGLHQPGQGVHTVGGIFVAAGDFLLLLLVGFPQRDFFLFLHARRRQEHRFHDLVDVLARQLRDHVQLLIRQQVHPRAVHIQHRIVPGGVLGFLLRRREGQHK